MMQRKPPKMRTCPHCGLTGWPGRIGTHIRYAHTEPVSERFWCKVDKSAGPDACWPWQGAITSHGYGCFKYGPRIVGAHKVAYLLAKGEVPAGMEIMHSCDNRPCCNPEHLSLGTRQDNVADKVRKGRSAKHSKKNTLNPEAVREIRRLRGIEPSGSLAKRFNVEQPHIINVWNRKVWKHV